MRFAEEYSQCKNVNTHENFISDDITTITLHHCQKRQGLTDAA